MTWSVVQSDCLDFLRAQPADSASLVMGSPPYESQRTYGIGFKLKGQVWVDWMVQVFQESLRVCTGLVAFVVQGPTRQFRWSATPALLMAELHRAGVNLRTPPIYHRKSISGSGGPDWWRSDYEFVVCATRKGKLQWSDNTATGKPPKYAPGGEMSYRLVDGKRREPKVANFIADGGPPGAKLTTKRNANSVRVQCYTPPKLANPGNVIHCKVGGGLLGSPLAHENEAPYPESLVEPFVRCFSRPGSRVIDPFCGSGTTGAVAVKWGRDFLGCDIRESQVELARRRISGVTPMLEVFNGQ